MTQNVVIIETGVANLSSVVFALERLGVTPAATSDADTIKAASHVILPGVGAARDAMKTLRGKGLVETIQNLKQPVLGICLGMQLLFEHTEEGDEPLLGALPGRIVKFRAAENLTIPHMGWNRLDKRQEHPLLEGVESGRHVYFVHSYHALVTENTLAESRYGDDFAAIVAKDNFMGCQFHPERSSETGAKILQNFVELEI